jgi:hypothetical protein
MRGAWRFQHLNCWRCWCSRRLMWGTGSPAPAPVTLDSRACGGGYAHCGRFACVECGGGRPGDSVPLRRCPGMYVSTAAASFVVPGGGSKVSLLGREKGLGRWLPPQLLGRWGGCYCCGSWTWMPVV